ncbi:hypothetical protein [Bradyrhizobium guangzhouense]|uniref:hypothetical protein n=1 Tax=Bradyrhizobium guangzhouense TaxID=1325095 RepID=UPI001009A40D|nr:hypothetical protein [Bradyrhizobium guangzhouense]
MGRHSTAAERLSLSSQKSNPTDILERLISENVELRRTAVDLALQTSILREGLSAKHSATAGLQSRVN